MEYNKFIDHTLLKPDATVEGIEKLCEEAKQYHFMDDWWPPFSQKTIKDCHRAIKEEKEKVFEKTSTQQSLEGKDVKDKARLISDYAKRKAEKWKKKN